MNSIPAVKVSCLGACLIFAWTLISNAHGLSQSEFNDRVSASLNATGTLTISTSYLTNYIARGVDPETLETGSPLLIKRNNKAIDFDLVDVQWTGLFPDNFNFNPLEFNEVESTYNLASYNYPNEVSWENSELVLHGGNLIELVTKFPTTADERIDALLLFLMNTLTVTEEALSVYQSAEKIGINPSIAILEKLTPLAEQVANFQDTLNKVDTYLAFTDLFIEQIDMFMNAAGVQPEEYNNFGILFDTYNYYKIFGEAVDDLNTVAGRSAAVINTDKRDEARGTIAVQYQKLLGSAANQSTDTIITDAVNQFANDFSNASDNTSKSALISTYALTPLAKTLDLYADSLEQDIKNKVGDIEAKRSELQFMKNGYAIVQLAKFIFASEGFVNLAMTEPEKVVPVLFELSHIVVGELITIDNTEVVAKKALQALTGADGRGAAFRKIGDAANTANTYMAAFNTGAGVGNKLIPLIWDLVLGENYLQASIIESKLTSLGSAKTVIQIDRNGETIANYTNQDGVVDHFIAADIGDKLTLKTDFVRPFLFDEARAPWLVNSKMNPQTIYNINIRTPSVFKNTSLCVRKMPLLTGLDFAVIERLSNSGFQNDCGDGELVANSVFTASSTTSLYDINNLPAQYRAQHDPVSDNDYVTSLDHTVAEDGEVLIVSYNGLDLNSILHSFSIVPTVGEASFDIDVSKASVENLAVEVELNTSSISNPDTITEIIWLWGDGTSTEGTLTNVSHTYKEAGKFEISVSITRASGQQSTASLDIDLSTFSPTISSLDTAIAVIEGTSAEIDLQLDQTSTSVVQINYSTRENTASSADFTPTQGTITFSPGQTLTQLQITTFDDAIDESDETFFIDFSNPANALSNLSSVTITLQDNDEPLIPSLSISDPAVAEGDSGSTNINFEVTLSQGADNIISVEYHSNEISASVNEDFITAQGSLTFFPNETRKVVSINILGDSIIEGDETLSVSLENAVNAKIEKAKGIGTIRDDDQLPEPLLNDSISIQAGDESAYVTWEDVTEAAGYNLYIAEESFGVPPDITNYASFSGARVIQNISVPEYTLTDLVNGTTYYVVLTAVNQTGESEPSEEIIFTPQEVSYNFRPDVSMVELAGDIYLLLESQDNGMQVLKLAAGTLELSKVFDVTEDVSGAALGKVDSQISIFTKAEGSNEYSQFVSSDGENWTLERTFETELCDQPCIIINHLVDSTSREEALLLRHNPLSRASLIYPHSDSVISTNTNISRYHYLNDGLLTWMQSTSASSAGFATLNLYQATPEETKTTELVRLSSFFAGVLPRAVNILNNQYEYIWTGKGSNERTRETNYGVGLNARIAPQLCTPADGPRLSDEVKDIHATRTMDANNGTTFEIVHQRVDDTDNIRIYRWTNSHINCHYEELGAYEKPQSYGVIDGLTLDTLYYSYYGNTATNAKLRRYDFTANSFDEIDILMHPDRSNATSISP